MFYTHAGTLTGPRTFVLLGDQQHLTFVADVAGHVSAHSAIEAADPTGRLVALASYLGLDWRWIRRRCRELSPHGCRGFARPRSRLLSVSGIDAACQYVAALDGEDSD